MSTTQTLLQRKSEVVQMLLENIPYNSEIKKEDYVYLFQENQKTAQEN